MFPQFPYFKKITLDDRKIILEYTQAYPPYNDFEFVSLWTYNSRGENSYSILHDNLVIKMEDFITGEFFYSFLGTHKTKETIETLLSRCREENTDESLRLLPEINFGSSTDLSKHFNIQEDRDSNDYVLSVEALASLQGSDYKAKRNQINKFKNAYPNFEVREIDLTDQDIIKQIDSLYSIWKEQKGEYKHDTQMEYIAIHRLFEVANLIHVKAIGIYIENRLVAFSTYHIMQLGYCIFSFHKADINFEGIYTLLNNELAKKLHQQGVKYIDYEQDLGIEGLRNAKMLWRPVFFLKKYTVSELT